MRRLPAAFVLILASMVGATAAEEFAPGQRPGERSATSSEIEAAAVGRSFRSGLSYGRDGSFAFRSGMLGRYRILDGSICVTFASGRNRCDKVFTDGKVFVLIDKRGKRYPFR
ncbi:hypothetical protein [Aureimonas leprariae]|uniref:Uncharacterized protein n=1 Tax=Plantimonas leprariae TaxID=2615207 RepID=A0A7V7PT21_9HYPH|nr:hypothetical protein [Aureimonas leprariae]KAB0682761.1 hypothetical protein F6X38_01375 [Aureimonas leprariae]